MRARAQSTVRVFDRDAGGSEMATVDKTYPRSECPPASPYIGDYHHTIHALERLKQRRGYAEHVRATTTVNRRCESQRSSAF